MTVAPSHGHAHAAGGTRHAYAGPGTARSAPGLLACMCLQHQAPCRHEGVPFGSAWVSQGLRVLVRLLMV